jgi:hypothetical protein
MHAKQTSDPPQEDDYKMGKIRERNNEEIGNELGASTSGLMLMMLIGVAKR